MGFFYSQVSFRLCLRVTGWDVIAKQHHDAAAHVRSEDLERGQSIPSQQYIIADRSKVFHFIAQSF